MDELFHHGVLGMRWGVRRYQNYDGTRIKTRGTGDISLKKGHKLERVYTTRDKYDPNDYRAKRLYVSDDAGSYLNDYFVDDVDSVRIQTFETKRKTIFAGEDSINKILKDMGKEPLHKVFDESGHYNRKPDGTDRDFLMSNKELGEEFIKRAIAKGYSGVRDPVDSMGMGFEVTAKILFDMGAIKKVSTKKYHDY